MANKETQPEVKKAKTRKNKGLTGGQRVALGITIPAMILGAGIGGYALYKHENTGKDTAIVLPWLMTPESSQAGAGEGKPTITTKTIFESTTTTLNKEGAIEYGKVLFFGFPEKVDPKNVDKADHKPFHNTIGLGSENIYGDPGVVLYGPDAAADPAKMEAFRNSQGHIDFFNSENNFDLLNKGESFVNLTEGTHLSIYGGEFTVEVGHQNENGDWVSDGLKVVCPQLDPEGGHNYILTLKGLFSDGKQGTDGNRTLKITEYVAGHTKVIRWPEGAFVSEEVLEQQALMSHSGGSNAGANGAKYLTVVMADINSKACSVIEQSETDGPYTPTGSNWSLK